MDGWKIQDENSKIALTKFTLLQLIFVSRRFCGSSDKAPYQLVVSTFYTKVACWKWNGIQLSFFCGTPPIFIRLMLQCLNANPSNRQQFYKCLEIGGYPGSRTDAIGFSSPGRLWIFGGDGDANRTSGMIYTKKHSCK